MVKKFTKKNQIIIAALAVMIAAAGYLNYSGKIFGNLGKSTQANADLTNQELLDISDEDVASASDDIKSQDGDENESTDGSPGDAVLTNGEASAVVAEAKVTREQVRAQNKESLNEIINSENLTDDQKQEAVNQLVEMTNLA